MNRSQFALVLFFSAASVLESAACGTPSSADKGVWITDLDEIKGEWMEIIADRATRT